MLAIVFSRKSKTRLLVWSVLGLCLAVVLLGFARFVCARPLTLTLVGAPIPGNGPYGQAVAKTTGGTYAIIGDHDGNLLRTFRLDPGTGTLSPIGSVPLENGPSAVAVSRDNRHVVATTLRGNNVNPFRLDPATGLLSPIGSVPSGGSGSVDVDVSDDNFVVVANKDSDNLGVLRLDPFTGGLSPVENISVGDAPNTMKITGPHVVVGHENSNDVHLYQFDQFEGLRKLDVKLIGRVTSLAVYDDVAVAATAGGNLHSFRIASQQLNHLWSVNLGFGISDITFSDDKTLFATGGVPNRLAAYEFNPNGLQLAGTLFLAAPPTSSTVATAQGSGQITYAIVNQYQGNQTYVIAARLSEFDFCLQDDENGDVLRFNSQTGEYEFRRCADGSTLTGRGKISRVGPTLNLEAGPWVSASVTNSPFYGPPWGSAKVSKHLFGTEFFINDRNLNDNTCACP